ncbi:MAG: hypothetical protein ACR5KV_03575 [Wolbachia sp.]
MNKEYDETKVKPAVFTSQKPEEANKLETQNAFSKKRKSVINFDDKKYGIKISIDQHLSNKKQDFFRLRGFFRSIPIIGNFLAKIFTSEKETYKKLQLQVNYSSKAEDKTYIDNKYTKEVGSKLESGNVERVDKKKKNLRL